jgi:hypothetical protein
VAGVADIPLLALSRGCSLGVLIFASAKRIRTTFCGVPQKVDKYFLLSKKYPGNLYLPEANKVDTRKPATSAEHTPK